MSYFTKMNSKLKEIQQKSEVIILAVETSCDETSAAVMRNGRHILSNEIASQIELHKQYGGVVPEIASRKHVEVVNPIIEEALRKAGIGFQDLDAVGVTYGPGLVGALLVGVSTAKALAYGLSLPLVGVHHIEGHISANYVEHQELDPPFLSLVVSGGHSHLVHVKDYGSYEVLGQTRDDAAGEAYDKVARTMGLGYPGGPLVDKLAALGNPEAVQFPRVYLKEEHFDFSFSGLKTAVINHLHNLEQRGECQSTEDIAASFQQAVVDVLVEKTIKAALKYDLKRIALAGGVASNSGLRKAMRKAADEKGLSLYHPSPVLCTDNAAMIGCAAYYNLKKGAISDLTLNAVPSLPLGMDSLR